MTDDAVRIVVRPLGNGLPLGFLALAGATLLVSALQLGWLEPAEGKNVALILLAFVFPLQLLSSVLGFLARDVVAGTGMGILSGTWLAVGLVTLTSPPGSTSDALGLFLVLVGSAMLVPASAAVVAATHLPASVLGTTALRFGVTGLYELSSSGLWEDLAGVVGLALCALALFTALVITVNESRRMATDGTVEAEPGVRGQL